MKEELEVFLSLICELFLFLGRREPVGFSSVSLVKPSFILNFFF